MFFFLIFSFENLLAKTNETNETNKTIMNTLGAFILSVRVSVFFLQYWTRSVGGFSCCDPKLKNI